jgi:hypothetical protein
MASMNYFDSAGKIQNIFFKQKAALDMHLKKMHGSHLYNCIFLYNSLSFGIKCNENNATHVQNAM